MDFCRIGFAVVLLAVFSLSVGAATNVTACSQAIDVAGETYELNQSISESFGGCLTVAADNVTLDCKGFTISGSDNGAPGIQVDTRGNATIRNCNVSHFEYGIRLFYSNSSTVTNSSISGATGTGAGIDVYWGYNTTITYNNVTSNDAPGIHMSATYANVSYNNVSFNDDVGIQTKGGSNSTFSYNTLDHNVADGILIDDDGYSVVSNNVISHTTGGGWVHLIMASSGADYTRIENNIVTDSATIGIQAGAYNCTVTNNTANDSLAGIVISTGLATLRNNSMNGNLVFGLFLFCTTAECYDNDVDTSNTANGEPIYYLNHKTNYVLENLYLPAANTANAKIIVVNSNNVTLRNIVIENNAGGMGFGGMGVELSWTNNSVVSNVTVSGCTTNAGFHINGSGITIENSSSTGNQYGIQLASSGNTVKNCNLTGNTGFNIDSGIYPVSLSGGGTSIQYSSLSTSGDISDAVYYAGTGVAAVNASANNDLNTTAQITMAFTGFCPRVDLYYYNDYSTDLNTIIAGGQLCNSTSTPACNILSCSGNTVTFTVEHFDSYGGQGNDIPEFSQVAALAALLLAAGAFAIVRRRR
ncbi:MAG: right-handed parallel beta-helix repeat-containing protein [Candidatus Micrarchaeota archaeon]|nr:right-handed parallel beta-helix repeat-containing protein [Candidatus Micrarchaeota archaeon]